MGTSPTVLSSAQHEPELKQKSPYACTRVREYACTTLYPPVYYLIKYPQKNIFAYQPFDTIFQNIQP